MGSASPKLSAETAGHVQQFVLASENDLELPHFAGAVAYQHAVADQNSIADKHAVTNQHSIADQNAIAEKYAVRVNFLVLRNQVRAGCVSLANNDAFGPAERGRARR